MIEIATLCLVCTGWCFEITRICQTIRSYGKKMSLTRDPAAMDLYRSVLGLASGSGYRKLPEHSHATVDRYRQKNVFLAMKANQNWSIAREWSTCITQISSGLTNIRPNSVVIRNGPCWGTEKMIEYLRRHSWPTYQSADHHRHCKRLDHPWNCCKHRLRWTHHGENKGHQHRIELLSPTFKRASLKNDQTDKVTSMKSIFLSFSNGMLNGFHRVWFGSGA